MSASCRIYKLPAAGKTLSLSELKGGLVAFQVSADAGTGWTQAAIFMGGNYSLAAASGALMVMSLLVTSKALLWFGGMSATLLPFNAGGTAYVGTSPIVMQTTPRWMGWLAAALGCLLVFIAAASAWSTRGFIRRAARADAVVVALNAGSAHPQVQFELLSGEELSFPAGGFISYNKGARAKVLYSPEAPIETVRLDDFAELWMPDIVQSLIGLVFLGIGVATLRKR